MSNSLKGVFLLITVAILISFSACSSVKPPVSVESEYPAWYNPSGFFGDSLAFHGFATAVSSDSIIAMANAELQARAHLESGIAVKLETVREDLKDNGSSLASDTDFILTLRNAHNAVEDVASEGEQEARSKNGYYTGFAQVTISKTDLRTLLKSRFKGRASYWQALSSSQVFSEEME